MSTNVSTAASPASRDEASGLFLAALSHFTIELCHNFLPVIYPLLIITMELSFQQIGSIALIVGLLTSLPQPFLGFLSDRAGAYRVSGLSILWLGTLMSVAGLASNYLLFALIVGLASLGSAAYHPAGAVLVAVNSRVRRGAGMSLFSVGGNLGSALSPVMIAALIPWMGINAAFSVLPFALIMSLLLLLQSRPATNVQRPSSGPIEGTSQILWLGLTLLVVASMARAWFQVSLMTYLPVWIESNGGTIGQASQMLSILAFSIGAGSMFGGTASDRVGRWIIGLMGFAFIGPAYWMFLQTTGLNQYLVLALIGFCIGNTYPIFVLMAQDCWTQRAAVASGLIMGIGWAPGGLGASFTGYVADNSSLDVGLQLLLIPPIVGLVCMVLWRFTGPE